MVVQPPYYENLHVAQEKIVYSYVLSLHKIVEVI